MRVGSENGMGAMPAGQAGAPQQTDSVCKGLENRIAAAQKQLQELASDKDMSEEEKMKKKQELLKQISELKNQLRQHRIELRRKGQDPE